MEIDPLTHITLGMILFGCLPAISINQASNPFDIDCISLIIAKLIVLVGLSLYLLLTINTLILHIVSKSNSKKFNNLKKQLQDSKKTFVPDAQSRFLVNSKLRFYAHVNFT